MNDETRDERPEERRQQPRRDVEPIRWREIARRRDRESLPFLRYFEDLREPTADRKVI